MRHTFVCKECGATWDSYCHQIFETAGDERLHDLQLELDLCRECLIKVEKQKSKPKE